MDLLPLKIISLDKEIFRDDVEKVCLPAEKGVVTLLARHMPMVSSINRGRIFIWHKGDQIASRVIPITGGFLSMDSNICTIFTDLDETNSALSELF